MKPDLVQMAVVAVAVFMVMSAALILAAAGLWKLAGRTDARERARLAQARARDEHERIP